MKSVRVMLAVSAVAVVVLAGCSSESTSDPGAAPTTRSAGASTQSSGGPLTDHVLTASDVPAGYSEMTIPADQLKALTTSLLESTKNSTVTPASCEPDASNVSADTVAQTAASYFQKAATGDLIGSVAVPDTDYVAKYVKYNLGDCATHQVASSVNGQSFTGVVTTKKIDVDAPGIDGAVVVEQKVTTDVPGTGTVAQTSFVALLPTKGFTASVTQKKLQGADAPDLETFRAVVAAAAKRATEG